VIELIGVEPANERAMYVLEMPRIEDYPETIEPLAPHFVVFVAADATAASDDALAAFARSLLRQGASYVCAWGPGCERLHDTVDVVREELNDDSESVVMTSWHEDESLDEALWFALFATVPDERYIETTDSVLAIVVAEPKWAARVCGRLGNPKALSDAVVADEPD
jgi:hypothetical protein